MRTRPYILGVGFNPEFQLLCDVVVSPQVQISDKNSNIKRASLWSQTFCSDERMIKVQEGGIPILEKQSMKFMKIKSWFLYTYNF